MTAVSPRIWSYLLVYRLQTTVYQLLGQLCLLCLVLVQLYCRLSCYIVVLVDDVLLWCADVTSSQPCMTENAFLVRLCCPLVNSRCADLLMCRCSNV